MRPRRRWRPSARGSRPRAGARGCSRSRTPTARWGGGPYSRSGRLRPTPPPAPPSGSTRPATRRGARSSWSARTSAGSTTTAVLRGRGRAVHQRPGRRGRRVLRPGRARRRGPAARRADGRRRVELRAGERLDARLVPLDDQRARGTAEHERATGATAGHGRPQAGAGVSARAAPPPPACDRRDQRAALPLLPNRLPLRRPARAGVSAGCRRRARRADDRGRDIVGKRAPDGRWPLENPHTRINSSTWARSRASRAAGTRSVRCACCAGPSRRLPGNG